MRAMLGGDGGGAAGQRASAEPLTERREVVSDGGRGCRQRRGASEPAPGHERRPVTRIEPQGFGGRRTPERRRSGLDITGQCRAVCSRLMCLGVHTPPCRSRSFAPWQPGRSGHVTRIPSDSRHLLGFWQALLRRGKQNTWCRSIVGQSATGIRLNSRLCGRTQAPCPSRWCAGALLTMAAAVVGHSCKRPFACTLLICKMGRQSGRDRHDAGKRQDHCRLRPPDRLRTRVHRRTGHRSAARRPSRRRLRHRARGTRLRR